MKWNLDDLYKSLADPAIKKDKALVAKQTRTFTKKYKGKAPTPKSLKDFEQILERLRLLSHYASFLHSKDTKSTAVGKFYQEIEEFYTNTTSDLIWFELQLTKSKVSIKQYSYFLEKLRKYKPFLLSEKEEYILTKKELTSSEAFNKFYDEKQSQQTFDLNIKGKVESLNSSELNSIIKSHPNRAMRRRATEVSAKTYRQNSEFYAFVLNTLLLDKQISDDLRGHKYPQESTYLNYNVDKKIVDTMTSAVVDNYPLAQRYYNKKQKLLKLPTLHEWDRYSQVKKTEDKYTWNQAKQIILKSFYGFDKQFGDIAKKFFDNNWIDAKVTKNRSSGAYCSYTTPSKHPYIFMNFTGKLDDIMTLAHELGHAVHGYLSRKNSLLHFSPSTATAEIASTFAESLVFDQLYKNSNSNNFKINLMADKIQKTFATVFRQTAFHLFESDIHEHRRTKGQLSTKEFGEYYQKRLQDSFGKGLTLTQDHKSQWMPITHFYRYNFYVFTYAFGDLLAMSLFDLYKKDKGNFVPKYLKVLQMGGSASPKDILKTIDQDITDKNFWQKGLDLLEDYIKEFELIA